jgi:ABC-type spermidine/putrescine transport system permease subunit I
MVRPLFLPRRSQDMQLVLSRFAGYWVAWFFALAARICAATASMVQLAPFWIGGNSIAN